jgi:opacity protein-like surface antigen
MQFAFLLGVIFQTFMINYAGAESTATSSTVPGGHRLEAFGGYSYLHFDSGLPSNAPLFGVTTTSMGMNGWTIAGTYNFTNYFGATAEFSGQYIGNFFGINASFPDQPTRTHLHNFLFGPTLTYRKNAKLTPFAHILVGDSHVTTLTKGSAFSLTRDALALAAGGGVDYKVGSRLTVRLAQFDYMHSNFDYRNAVVNFSGFSTSQNHFRYSAGIVIKAF